MTSNSDAIPIVETYRGVGIHDGQPRKRIEGKVKPEIDVVMGTADIERLVQYASDQRRPPEARLLAAAKCEALYELAAQERRARPKVDLDRVRAMVVGLDSRHWRCPNFYTSLLHPFGPSPHTHPDRREPSLDDDDPPPMAA